MYEDKEFNESTHLESCMEVGDEHVFENTICRINNGKESFSEYFSLGSLEHKLLFTSDNIRDDIKHGYDHISGFIVEKEKFQTKLRTKINVIKRKDKMQYFKELEKNIHCVTSKCCLKVYSYIPKFLKNVEQDPDMHFFGHYNWYYTGGTLQTVSTKKDNHLLLFVEKADKDHFCIAPLLDNSKHIESSEILRVVPNEGQEIFQVVGVENHNLFGTRQKYDCSVFSIGFNSGKKVIKQIHKKNSDCPFVGFDISSVYNELCTINTKGSLRFWDLNEEHLPSSVRYSGDDPSHDKWHSLWYSISSPCEVVVACRKFVKWFDRRTKKSDSIVDFRGISGREEDEEISLHFQSKYNSNGIYIATNIGLLLMDIRMLEAPVHNWSHRLLLPPIYSTVISLSECREIACIGNHYPGDVVLAFNSSDLSYPLVEVPSRMDTLLRNQSEGKCLDPSLQPRLAPGISGLASFCNPDSSSAEILTQSRTSDILSQAVFSSNSNATSELKDFNTLVTKKEKLNASNRWNMSKLYKSLSDFNNESLKVSAQVPTSPQVNQKWQRSLEELKKYKDPLSSIILDEWDSLIQSDEKQTKHIEKVSAWLDSCIFSSVKSGSSDKQ